MSVEGGRRPSTHWPWNQLLGVKPRSAITKGPNHWWRSQHPKARPCRPNPIEPPWYVTRMPGGVGGVAPRGVPYPDQCLLIGIGGHLAVPPLPHHRAYGSRTTAVRLG